jgi:Na+/melibiose symporter-like transporter
VAKSEKTSAKEVNVNPDGTQALETKKKLDVKKTIIIGFGFMSTMIAWAIYDPYVTKILNRVLTDSAVITSWSNYLTTHVSWLVKLAQAQGENVVASGGGFTLVPLFIGIVMTFDNIFGVIFQPMFGKLSDNTHSKLGKRRPFIVTCAPVSAVLFAMIPVVYLQTKTLWVTMIFIIAFVFSMSLWRSPVIALMPDLTPPELQSEGNAIINLMGGIGSAIGMVAGTAAIYLTMWFSGYTKQQIEADETLSFPYVFLIGSVVMIIGMLVLLFFVKEKDTSIVIKGAENEYADAKARKAAEKAAKKAEKEKRNAIKLTKGEKRSLRFMLMCLFFLFCGTNSITTFFSLFAQEILHIITAKATILMLIFAVVAAVAAIPAGKMGTKMGRKKTIMAGLAIFLSAFVIFFATFIGLLAKQNLSVNKYITTNNAYIAIDDQINEHNSVISDEAEKENKTLSEDEILNMDEYIKYLKETDSGKTSGLAAKYSAFDASVSDSVRTGIINVARDTLGNADVDNFGEALELISEKVASVTHILSILIYPVLIFAGAANMFITVNTLPLVLEIGGPEKVGTFTGYYYTATFSAQIVSPILYGFIRMFAGTYMSLFYYAPIMFVLSLILISFVHHGEPIPDDLIKKAQEQGD